MDPELGSITNQSSWPTTHTTTSLMKIVYRSQPSSPSHKHGLWYWISISHKMSWLTHIDSLCSHTLLFISHQHQHMALVGNFILKMFLLMTMTWSLKIALTICVKMTYSDSDTKNLQPQSCGIFNIYWYLSAT